MIYGDNPQKINEREDKLGLKSYSYAPQITAVMQSGNLYVYCGSSPIKYSDKTGETGSLALQWASGTWWLIGIDGPVPAGDALYVIGIGLLSLIDALLLIGVTDDAISQTEASAVLGTKNQDIKELKRAALIEDAVAAAPGAPDPNDGNHKRNLKQIDGNKQANKISQKLGYKNAEVLKREFVGSSGALFNMARDTKTGEIILVLISDSSVQVATGLFI